LSEIPLSLATLLGGIAAVMYFWEKRNLGWLSHLKQSRLAPAIPLDPSSLCAYASSHHRPLSLTRAIAQRRGLEVRSFDSESAWLDEQVKGLGLKTVRELDGLIKRYGHVASCLTDYSVPQQPIDSDFIIAAVFEIVVMERDGKEGLQRFSTALKYSHRDADLADELFHQYGKIKRHG